VVTAPPVWLRMLVARYDPVVFRAPGERLRVGITGTEGEAWDVVLTDGAAMLVPQRVARRR
jgi:hypothetical protein